VNVGPPPDYDAALRVEVISFSTFLRQDEDEEDVDDDVDLPPLPNVPDEERVEDQPANQVENLLQRLTCSLQRPFGRGRRQRRRRH